MRAFSRIMLTLLMVSVVFTTTLNIEAAEAGEPNVVEVLRELGFTNIAESTAETFMPAGTYNVTLYAEFADFHDRNNLTYYRVGTNEYNDSRNLIFSGPEGNKGYVTPPISKIFAVSDAFGLSFGSPDHNTTIYFTETSRNPDGLKHAMVYINLDDPNMYLIGFENLYGLGDKDYNDMVISLKIVSQPVNIAGVSWYIVNATREKAMIYMDGGGVVYSGVSVFSWDRDKTIEELNFLNKMVSSGFDVLFNKDSFGYNGSQTLVKDTATWLLNNGYKRVFLFGWSAGGVIVAYEV